MAQDTVTVRITRETHHKLKVVAALMGKSILAALAEMIDAKLKELEHKRRDQGSS